MVKQDQMQWTEEHKNSTHGELSTISAFEHYHTNVAFLDISQFLPANSMVGLGM